jgi:hypothetical protein
VDDGLVGERAALVELASSRIDGWMGGVRRWWTDDEGGQQTSDYNVAGANQGFDRQKVDHRWMERQEEKDA